MRFSFDSTSILTILFCWSGSSSSSSSTSAFVPSTTLPLLRSPPSSSSSLILSSGLTSEDILARARAAVGDKGGGKAAGADGPTEVLPAEHFSPEILEDIKSSLQMFEHRIANGPGSLSYDDVEELDACTKRIVEDLLNYNGKEVVNVGTPPTTVAVPPAEPAAEPAPVVSFAVPPPATSQSPPPPPPPAFQSPPPPPPQPMSSLLQTAKEKMEEQSTSSPPAAAQQQQSSTTSNMLHAVQPVAPRPNPNFDPDQMDTSEDDGPAYDGTGGLGLAKDTANTYIIPGMDEMTGEEYRTALQKSVSERQANRSRVLGPSIGNMSSNNYLDNLS